ncbi:Integrase [Croceitalea dokdonensis DOKDO 023]|uniref:Integrase n=1 Tax=Croceitalea dokdonensis DOKDO 023 TaxID=1300341 RepID=A0A0P7AUI5_9FLAO|nr:Integrase [Croceitalea dokdonensis DOKDO 023]
MVTLNNCILLKEEKNSNKDTRLIPLSNIAKDILGKYDYKLPLISNQKQNEAIKEVIEKIGFTHDVEYSRVKGVVQERFVRQFKDRISTHTARPSFITIMRNKGIADKTIMSISGHTGIKSFNQYHQVDNAARLNAITSVFDSF